MSPRLLRQPKQQGGHPSPSSVGGWVARWPLAAGSPRRVCPWCGPPSSLCCPPGPATPPGPLVKVESGAWGRTAVPSAEASNITVSIGENVPLTLVKWSDFIQDYCTMGATSSIPNAAKTAGHRQPTSRVSGQWAGGCEWGHEWGFLAKPTAQDPC